MAMFIQSFFQDNNFVNSELAQINYADWIYVRGPDPTGTLAPFFATNAAMAAVNLANEYVTLGGASSPANFADYNSFNHPQQVIFNQQLLVNSGANNAVLTRIDGDLNINSSTNPDIQQRWFTVALFENYSPATAAAEAFVGSTGNNKFLNPIYNSMVEAGRTAEATTWYNNNLSFYTITTQKMISEILML